MIKKQDIENLATLARLHVTEEEKEALATRLGSIIEYIGRIDAVQGNVDETEFQALTQNVMREDAHPHESGMHTEAILAVAPKAQDGFVKVKKILNG